MERVQPSISNASGELACFDRVDGCGPWTNATRTGCLEGFEPDRFVFHMDDCRMHKVAATVVIGVLAGLAAIGGILCALEATRTRSHARRVLVATAVHQYILALYFLVLIADGVELGFASVTLLNAQYLALDVVLFLGYVALLEPLTAVLKMSVSAAGTRPYLRREVIKLGVKVLVLMAITAVCWYALLSSDTNMFNWGIMFDNLVQFVYFFVFFLEAYRNNKRLESEIGALLSKSSSSEASQRTSARTTNREAQLAFFLRRLATARKQLPVVMGQIALFVLGEYSLVIAVCCLVPGLSP